MGSLPFVPIYVLACLVVFDSGVVGYPDLSIDIEDDVVSYPDLKIDVGAGCWQNPCIPTELRGPKFLEKIKTDNDEVSTPEKCQAKCQEKEECNYFSHEILGNNEVCYLLKSECDKEYTFNEKKISGPKSCEDQPFCEPLGFPTENTPETVYWTCEMDEINPYSDQIPIGTLCYTRCGKDSDGIEVEYKAECVEDPDNAANKIGKWEKSDDSFDPLKKDESKCPCPEFNFWYNPNTEDGAIFSCTEDITFGEDPINVQLEPTNRCVLICGYEVDRDIFCHNGQWNDADPEEYESSGSGIFCYDEPSLDAE